VCSSNVVCVEGELYTSSYNSEMVGLAMKNKETSLNCLCMPPCIRCWKLGLGGSPWGTTAPLVHPHPGGTALRPPSCGWFLGGPGPLPRRCSAQLWCEGGLLHLFLLRTSALRFLLCAFCLVLFIFHLYLNVCPTKHVFSNTSGTRSMVKAYV